MICWRCLRELTRLPAAMFKPNVSPLLLDQMTTHVPRVKTLKSGERVIEDPEHSTERVMLWFYLLINIGAFMSTATSYSAKYVGWWLAFLLPLLLYVPLPLLLMWLKPRLIHHKPGGSDLPNVFRVLGYCFANGGFLRIGRKGLVGSCEAFLPGRPRTARRDPLERPVRCGLPARPSGYRNVLLLPHPVLE